MCFSIFLPFCARLAEKFAKSTGMTPKILIWVTKTAEFDAEFESVEKVEKTFTRRKLEG